MPGSFLTNPAPVVHPADGERELIMMRLGDATAKVRRPARHQHLQYRVTALARHGRPMHRRRQPAVLVRAQVTRRGEKSGNGH